MSSAIRSPLRRHLFNDPTAAPGGDTSSAMLRLLLAQDGSTTRLCEAVAAAPVELHVLEQRVVREVPTEVQVALPSSSFIERITCLAARGEVLMDNLSYIALDGMPNDLRHDLEAGRTPIGHLLARMWVRRTFMGAVPSLLERLWAVVGLSDPEASRAYCITTPEGPRMVIAETFRRGMLMKPPRSSAS